MVLFWERRFGANDAGAKSEKASAAPAAKTTAKAPARRVSGS
jgi:hypothetical protein